MHIASYKDRYDTSSEHNASFTILKCEIFLSMLC